MQKSLLLLPGLLVVFSCSAAYPESNLLGLLLLEEDSVPASAAPEISSISPPDGTTGLRLAAATVSVTFSSSIDPATITYNTSGGACAGTVQFSADNFSSCRPVTTSGSGTAWQFTVDPGASPEAGTTFRLRITTGVKGIDGLALRQEYSSSTGYRLFNPGLDVTGAVVWHQGYAQTVLKNALGEVLVWGDSSGNSRIAQASGLSTNWPTFIASEPLINNRPGLQFSGVSQKLDYAAEFMNFSAPVIFWVGRRTGGAGWNTIFADDSGGSTIRLRIAANAAGNYRIEAFDGTAPDSLFIFSGAAEASSYGINTMELIASTASLNYYRNGTLAQTISDLANYTTTTSWDLAPLGAMGSLPGAGAEYLNGEIAEIIIYNGPLSAADRQKIECYLSDKYAITVAQTCTWP